mgnify:CR=1 FL=1
MPFIYINNINGVVTAIATCGLLEGWSGQSEEIWNYEFATRFGNCNLGLLRSFRTLRAQISKLARSLRTIPRIAPVSSCHSC